MTRDNCEHTGELGIELTELVEGLVIILIGALLAFAFFYLSTIPPYADVGPHISTGHPVFSPYGWALG